MKHIHRINWLNLTTFNVWRMPTMVYYLALRFILWSSAYWICLQNCLDDYQMISNIQELYVSTLSYDYKQFILRLTKSILDNHQAKNLSKMLNFYIRSLKLQRYIKCKYNNINELIIILAFQKGVKNFCESNSLGVIGILRF